jgi:hypothetical protein
MSVILSCACGKRLRIPDGSAGKKVRCPGCKQILTATAQTPTEELPEVILLPDPAPVEQEDLPEVLPAFRATPSRPPPLPLPSSRGLDGTNIVELIPVKATADEGIWRLELGEEEVRLLNHDGAVAMRFRPDQANLRIFFPSFWLSIKHLEIREGANLKLQFRPEKVAVARIRSYLDNVLRADPGARRALKMRGLAIACLGLLATLVGAAAFAYLWTAGMLGARDRLSSKGTAWSIVLFFFGFILMAWGTGMYRKSARMGRP